mmetsp:Transcript_5366/g.6775  ORF Transcript_5366/g.6775 Transcript_5366/m.6775 type:complete len:130 (+) Transcript_5366:70-459(+)|eukprot:CAMPEP_0204853264 /NCGR_PEP_ID=MMETSP1347-20130617/13082_1 /ASSEMBLY_ACC=CAM_ASM_000690 /TAXON_ID=215587 /ORGANISM="Aplanochytrium stocchinoi, Strain GSBS06" /LENGTH=129 /DNA_ID=CAMNT_0051998045 /DNA_START=101 /DNA_END=490 /DNA_ORIENTATION=+
MGRLSAFLGGVLCGGAAYGSLSLWSQSEFSRIDHQIRAIHLELAGGSAKKLPAPESGILNVGPLADFKDKALDSFRKKWNQSLRSTYEVIHDQLKPKVVIAGTNEYNPEEMQLSSEEQLEPESDAVAKE